MVVFVLSVAVALGISFLCSLMEATLLSLTPAQVAEISARHPVIGSIWQRFKAAVEHPIAVILILNTTAHTIGASVAGSKFDALYGDEWIWVFALAFTFVMLQFTEILPKTLGVRYNRELAIVAARPLQFSVWLLRPILYAIHFINRPFELRKKRNSATLEEITALAGLAQVSQEISKQQEQIITAAANLSRLRVDDVLIPVDEVSFLSTEQSVEEALASALHDSHTRFPVCEQGDFDRVVGYVNLKDLVYVTRDQEQHGDLRAAVRPLHATRPDASAADLLKDFVEHHVHIALVRDKAGKTLGLVTLEDLMEEIVGDVQDELDHLPHMVHELSDGTWLVGGGLSVAELAARINRPLPAVDGSFSAWLTKQIGRPPQIGDSVTEADATFTVRRIRRGKVFEASVSRSGPAAPSNSLSD